MAEPVRQARDLVLAEKAVAGQPVVLTWFAATDVLTDRETSVTSVYGQKKITDAVYEGNTVSFTFPTDLGFNYDANTEIAFSSPGYLVGVEGCSGVGRCSGAYNAYISSDDFRLP